MAKHLVKIPKPIAGIKLPRQMRKGPLGAFLASSGGQVIVAELLLVLAGVLATVANPATRTGRDLRARSPTARARSIRRTARAARSARGSARRWSAMPSNARSKPSRAR